jgi:hypothetical protein
MGAILSDPGSRHRDPAIVQAFFPAELPRRAESHLLTICRLRPANIAGASGGRIRQDLIPGTFLRGRWLRNRRAGVMERWSIGVLNYCDFGELNPLDAGWGILHGVRMQYLSFTVASNHLPPPAKPDRGRQNGPEGNLTSSRELGYQRPRQNESPLSPEIRATFSNEKVTATSLQKVEAGQASPAAARQPPGNKWRGTKK